MMFFSHPPTLNKLRWSGVLVLLSMLLVWGCTKQTDSSVRYNSASIEYDEFDHNRNAPPSAKTLHAMSEVLAAQRKDKESEFLLLRCIREHPYYLPAYNVLAQLYTRQGRTNDAVELLSKVLEMNELDPVVHNNLGVCYMIQHDYDRAYLYFQKAACIMPSKERYRANMATALGILGREEEARALLNQVLSDQDTDYNVDVLTKAHSKAVDKGYIGS